MVRQVEREGGISVKRLGSGRELDSEKGVRGRERKGASDMSAFQKERIECMSPSVRVRKDM